MKDESSYEKTSDDHFIHAKVQTATLKKSFFYLICIFFFLGGRTCSALAHENELAVDENGVLHNPNEVVDLPVQVNSRKLVRIIFT